MCSFEQAYLKKTVTPALCIVAQNAPAFQRANLAMRGAGNGVQQAIEEVDGLGRGVAAANFEGLVNHNRKTAWT